MEVFVYVIAAFLICLLLFFVSRGKSKPKDDNDQGVKRPNRGPPVEAGSHKAAGARRRRKNIHSRIAQQINERPEDRGEEGEDDGDGDSTPKPKIGTKKLKKLQEKEDRRLAREAEEAEREEKKRLQEERDEERKKIELEEKEEEEKQLELERKLKEEKEQKEHEEYLKLKEMFSVEEEGQVEVSSDEQSQNQLQQFITYIKDTKVVLLEDLASHFGLRTQQAIDRVQDLLKDELITGVIDDRGKFIYISEEELQGIANFIKQRGRVSISEIAKASNSLVNLSSENEELVT